MASSSDVLRRRVMRFKLQLTDAAESATVLKILQKLKDLDITLDILAETGIGKTVNSLRKHGVAGEFAKSLVRGWKKLVPKKPTSLAEDGDVSDSPLMSIKAKLDDQKCPQNGGLSMEDLNNNVPASHGKSQEASDEHFLREAEGKDQARKREQNEKDAHDDRNALENHPIQEEKMDYSVVSEEKKDDHCVRKSGDCDGALGNKNSDARQKSRPDSKEKLKSSYGCEGSRPDKEPAKKSKPPKESSQDSKETFPFEPRDKSSKKLLKRDNGEYDRASGKSKSPEARKRKRNKREKEKQVSLGCIEESEHKRPSKPQNKKAKTEHEVKARDHQEQRMSFESCLNYDENVSRRKERSGAKKPHKRAKAVLRGERTKDQNIKPVRSPVMSASNLSPQKFKEPVLEEVDILGPAALSDCEKPFGVEYFGSNAEKESDSCDVSEESAVFTGQRLNRKMQVYSGAKTVFLPAMMSLYQQCIRTLQNNINLLYETGGVPFEILEPVLERCTPEQLLRIEECNPVYIGVTDHLWGKHCRRDFKDSKLQEYESWKEMYIRLSEEREKKFKRLTKSIISAHSQKPKGRQVKMAFIHTVAKPPRDVRIQQEINGTAVQQPQQPRCSVKVQDNRPRPSNEPTRSNGAGSGTSNTPDPRKKTRVAPMMAKSLKAFKKQMGRR